jgi:hypothetical protein
MTAISRRSALAGVASLTVPSTALAAYSATSIVDPIFAAIERHREAYMLRLTAGRIRGDTPDWGPDCDEAKLAVVEKEDDAAYQANEDAAMALTTIRPTTIAGILALLEYVEFFNAGGIFLPDDRVNWSSAAMFWPRIERDHESDEYGYLILANVRAALDAQEVRS